MTDFGTRGFLLGQFGPTAGVGPLIEVREGGVLKLERDETHGDITLHQRLATGWQMEVHLPKGATGPGSPPDSYWPYYGQGAAF